MKNATYRSDLGFVSVDDGVENVTAFLRDQMLDAESVRIDAEETDSSIVAPTIFHAFDQAIAVTQGKTGEGFFWPMFYAVFLQFPDSLGPDDIDRLKKLMGELL